MPDLPESRDQVIGYAAEFGYDVSASQLARWHRAGLLPRPRQRPLGRGKGTETIYPPGASAQVVALCQIKDEERRLDQVAFRLWWDGFAIDPELIKAQLAAAICPPEGDGHTAGSRARNSGSALGGVLERSLGRRRVEAITAMVSQAAPDDGAPPTLISWDSMTAWPPSLDDTMALIAQATTERVTGPAITQLIAHASTDDLLRARDRSRSLLTWMRANAGPMAWLYGQSGSLFRMIDRLANRMTPADYPGMVAVMLAFAPLVRPKVLAAIDAGTEPPLAQELRLILAIRDKIPGAAQVLTPMAIRAVLRDKEAARHHRPKIEQFITEHRAEIESVLSAIDSQAAPRSQ
jgi:hypothetical protein